MPVTQEEIDHFHQFGTARLASNSPTSPQKCLKQWRQTREIEETLEEIRPREAVLAAADEMPLAEAIALMRDELGPRTDHE